MANKIDKKTVKKYVDENEKIFSEGVRKMFTNENSKEAFIKFVVELSDMEKNGQSTDPMYLKRGKDNNKTISHN